jgi:prephenate dehydratase
MKTNVTFLGPFGATFTHDAYNWLARRYGAPAATEGEDGNYIPASANQNVLDLILNHGGYGALAMETRAGGKVAEPVATFIHLLKKFGSAQECPFHIIAAVNMRLHFCLMVRPGTQLEQVEQIIAHPKAINACKEHVAGTQKPALEVSSNGEAARMIAEVETHQRSAALGPRSAASKYGLKILNEGFEDDEAVTTFFLLGPKEHKVAVCENRRMLIAFKLKDQPSALVKALTPLGEAGLNLKHVHDVYAGNGTYDFGTEMDVPDISDLSLEAALAAFAKTTERNLVFGPFEVVSS